MSVRVGHITRHKDVHGLSGTGAVADVFEATNGKCMVVWNSAHSSVNLYDHIKDVERTHSHGGKSLVVWDYESPPDKDPMDEVLNGDKPKLSEAEIEDIAEDAAAQAATFMAQKAREKLQEKIEESDVPPAPALPVEEEPEAGEEPVESEPEGEKRTAPKKKKTPSRKAPAGKEKK